MIKTITNTQTVERLNSHTDRRNQPGSFDPVGFTVVPPRRFEDLRVGDVFRAPSRTLTDAHASAFQTVSANNHPIHYDVEYARRHGHTAPVVHGLQVFAFGDGSRRDHEDSLLSQRCGIRQPVGSNHHHSFLKRSEIDISQNVKFPSKR